jgi:cobalt-precorrin-5B (C1)-methyltransferase
MKSLREGYTTGSCACASSVASVIWQKTGNCPDMVEIETPAGIKLNLAVTALENFEFECGVIKDAGDDPDCTDGCLVKSKVKIFDYDGNIIYKAGDGVGIVTKKGLKIPVGQPAINPVPREMIEKSIRKIIGSKSAQVTVSVENGNEIAVKTFNKRLGIEGGLSILGTTGIVRPMSEEAVKDSLRLELSMCRAEYGKSVAFVSGYSGEKFLRNNFSNCGGIVLCSNYLGFMLDEAEKMGFTHILLAGGTGKFVKPSANIMNMHSHIAGGQREIICTHAALCGADTECIREIYECSTTKAMTEMLKKRNLEKKVFSSVAESAVINCNLRTHNNINTALILTDENNQIIAQSESVTEVLEVWRKNNA